MFCNGSKLGASTTISQRYSILYCAEQTTLATLMQQYITADVIEDHCNGTKQMMELPMPAMIHDDENFLPFHRAYLEGMEDFLLIKGHPEFVPLPAWDPGTICPTAFRVVDADAASTACSGTTALPTNWQPLSRPRFLKHPVLAGSNNDICDWNPGIGPSSFEQVLEGQPGNIVGSSYHNSVHNNMGGIMTNFRSPGLLAFWIWHAYVDDIWKEYQCQCANQNPIPRQIDLYIKNTPGVITANRDMGVEPNWGSKPLWESTDIWVRNTNDGFTNDETQNPEYNGSTSVDAYVYVRVRNRGCIPTTGNEVVKLFWSKSGAYQLYPKPWDGSVLGGTSGTTPMGGLLGTRTIGQVIPPGGEAIIKFDWNIPNPNLYGGMDGSTTGSTTSNGWHYCLLAKGKNPTVDPDLGTLSNIDLGWVVADNNHIAWKNITVVDFVAGKPGFNGIDKYNGGTIAIGNLTDAIKSYDIVFNAPITYKNPISLTSQAEVLVSLNPLAWSKWAAAGFSGTGFKLYDREKRQIIIQSDSARLNNLSFNSGELATMNLAFNFLTKDVNEQQNFDYRVIQLNKENGLIVGGETYTIKKPLRDGFNANAGADKSILEGENTTITAATIGESATYNWYDSNDSLIYTGTNFTVSPEITTKYKLEVIATDDGFKDYDEVQVKIKENYITSLAPNPVSTNMLISYKLGASITSAYVIVMQPYGASNNYILNTNSDSKSIDLSNYSPGNYTVILVCNGIIADTKTIVKY